jgi:hypothetical protein
VPLFPHRLALTLSLSTRNSLHAAKRIEISWREFSDFKIVKNGNLLRGKLIAKSIFPCSFFVKISIDYLYFHPFLVLFSHKDKDIAYSAMGNVIQGCF